MRYSDYLPLSKYVANRTLELAPSAIKYKRPPNLISFLEMQHYVDAARVVIFNDVAHNWSLVTDPMTWFGRRSATHVGCFEQE